jgi:response regulator of citrate/malate metabolism
MCPFRSKRLNYNFERWEVTRQRCVPSTEIEQNKVDNDVEVEVEIEEEFAAVSYKVSQNIFT